MAATHNNKSDINETMRRTNESEISVRICETWEKSAGATIGPWENRSFSREIFIIYGRWMEDFASASMGNFSQESFSRVVKSRKRISISFENSALRNFLVRVRCLLDSILIGTLKTIGFLLTIRNYANWKDSICCLIRICFRLHCMYMRADFYVLLISLKESRINLSF